MNTQTLARQINLPLLVFYGLGTILGAGIYVLVGKVAGSAGLLAPVSFIVAAAIAWLTAKSYCQLVVLFPKSAGEAIYIDNGFKLPSLSLVTGLMIILTGIVSAATLTKGFIGYLIVLVPVNESVAMITIVMLLMLLAIWGIGESLTVAALVTVIEVVGLLIVLAYCGDSLVELPDKASSLFVPQSIPEVAGVLSGAFLAFYAFIGFEDMVNVVEEVKEPSSTMPKAILWVVVISTTLYVLIALVACLSLSLPALEQSTAPLTDILKSQNVGAAKVVTLISILAIINGVLIQIIMASRVCYGLSMRFNGPSFLHAISTKTRTPVYATVLIASCIVLAALFFPLTTLAKATSFIILIIFTLINIALFRIKRRNFSDCETKAVSTAKQLGSYPLLAGLLCFGLLTFQLTNFVRG